MKNPIWPRLRLRAVAGAVGLTALLSVSLGATAASAGSRPPAVTALSSSSGGTATILYFLTYNGAFKNGSYACNQGSNYNSPAIPITSAENECGVRVWLHQDPYPQYQTSGWAYCVNRGGPHSIPLDRSNPQNIYISKNTSPCP
jgi:hypothetical protein